MDLNLKAKEIVDQYVAAHLDKSDPSVKYDVYVVWQCYILGNAKWLLSTTLPDGKYYEVTYDRDKKCFYLDAYVKLENKCVTCVAVE